MGFYMYINDNDRVNMRKVEDKALKELFEEALAIDETLMVSTHKYEIKKFLKKPEQKVHYTVYHECFVNGNPMFQARQQISASGTAEVVTAYLYGIINGSNIANKK